MIAKLQLSGVRVRLRAESFQEDPSLVLPIEEGRAGLCGRGLENLEARCESLEILFEESDVRFRGFLVLRSRSFQLGALSGEEAAAGRAAGRVLTVLTLGTAGPGRGLGGGVGEV